jgi:threonine dehydrogenase-like Zn-dependent dehydrogenase
LKSAILALRHSGRVSLMGGLPGDVVFPHWDIMHKILMLKGTWMYNREDVGALIKMVERGVLKLGESAGLEVVGQFRLEDWDKAFACAAENSGSGRYTLIVP